LDVFDEMSGQMTIIPKGAILAPNGEIAQDLALRNNWYEGSRWSPDRSWVWYPPQQAKKDLDRFTRYELIKHARYLYKNSPFIRGLIERLVVLTVGTGIYPVFKSDDEAFVKKATRIWMQRVKNIHLGPKCSFALYVRAIARARFLDGECCSIKTYDQRTYEAKVQGVEAERLTGGQAGDNGTNETKNWLDGQKLDAQGNVVGYIFRGSDTIYEPEQVIHHYSPSRLGQYRGETILAASINTARDVDDILSLEKQAVKEASATKDIIKTQSGELDPETFRNLRYGNQFPTVFALPPDDRNKDDYYQIKLGSKVIVLKRGDEYQPYKVDRTSPAWIGFMEFLSNSMCISTLIPPSVLLWIDTGGTDIRRDLDIAQRVVGAWQNDLIDELEELRQYLMSDDFTDGELRNQPDDLEVIWHCPPKLTVDRAQAKEDRADVQAGLMSIEEFHARQGDDPSAYEQAMVNGAKRRLKLIKGAGFENVREFVEVISLNAQLFQPDSEGEPEPAPAPAPKPKPNK
jgi:capsid protein